MNESSNYSSVLGYESVSNTTTHSWDCTREELYTLTNSQIYSWAQVCNESACYRQEYYTTFYSLIGSFFQSIVFIVGVLGNILVCAVVLKTRSMRTTTNCYLVSLAVADTISLVASVPQEVLSYHILSGQWVWGSVGCSLMVYLQYLGIDASALSLTAFTVERYIAICHPIKSKSICTLSRAKKIIGFCWLFAILYCTPWFYLTKHSYDCYQGENRGEFLNVGSCGFRLPRSDPALLSLFIADLTIYYLLPLLLSVILYVLIGKTLLSKSRNRLPGGGTRSSSLSTTAALKANNSRVQVVKMLACVVVIFATLWVPYRGMLVYNTFVAMGSGGEAWKDLWYLMFAKTCVYINCAINPILYNAMSDKFRKSFRNLLVCGQSNIGRRSAAAAMAATMATDIGQSVTGTIPGGDRFRKAQNIYSSSGNENGSRTIRSSPPSQNSQSQNDRGCVNVRTEMALVEIPKHNIENNHTDLNKLNQIAPQEISWGKIETKIDGLSSSSVSSGSNSHQTCLKHQINERCKRSKKDAYTEMERPLTADNLKQRRKNSSKDGTTISSKVVITKMRSSTAV